MQDGRFIIGREHPRGRAPGPGAGGHDGAGGSRYLELPHPTVSRHHAELIVLGGTYHLRDLGSTNGTWIVRDGRPEPLHEGYVELDTPLRLGERDCTLAELLGGG